MPTSIQVRKKWICAIYMGLFCLGTQSVFAAGITDEVIKFGRFGAVHVYKNSPQPKNVVLFVSGDGGWNLGVVDMAKTLVGMDSLVAGIDITHYLKQLDTGKTQCTYPAADFEAFSQYLQKRYNYPDYVKPVLVGYSSGATLVYAIAVQAPPNTFLGAMSLGFCPDLDIAKPFCAGEGLKATKRNDGKGFDFLPAEKLKTPWVVFQGEIDQVCNAKMTYEFAAQTPNSSLVKLLKVGHGYSVQRNWMPQFRDEFSKLVSNSAPPKTASTVLEGLPLVEVKATAGDSDSFAVIISGDGGWASIDRQLADTLSQQGIPVIGLDSLHYFWKKRAPDEAGKDLTRIVEKYFELWNKKKVILIGYSRGADVLPFMINRLPESLKHKISRIALLGAEGTVDFEFKLSDWIPVGAQSEPYKVLPEVQQLTKFKLTCIYGEDETDSLCTSLNPKQFRIEKLTGGHHFGGNYQALVEIILN